jgi:hypothetical protein
MRGKVPVHVQLHVSAAERDMRIAVAILLAGVDVDMDM